MMKQRAHSETKHAKNKSIYKEPRWGVVAAVAKDGFSRWMMVVILINYQRSNGGALCSSD